jgi:hypothetical protein
VRMPRCFISKMDHSCLMMRSFKGPGMQPKKRSST